MIGAVQPRRADARRIAPALAGACLLISGCNFASTGDVTRARSAEAPFADGTRYYINDLDWGEDYALSPRLEKNGDQAVLTLRRRSDGCYDLSQPIGGSRVGWFTRTPSGTWIAAASSSCRPAAPTEVNYAAMLVLNDEMYIVGPFQNEEFLRSIPRAARAGAEVDGTDIKIATSGQLDVMIDEVAAISSRGSWLKEAVIGDGPGRTVVIAHKLTTAPASAARREAVQAPERAPATRGELNSGVRWAYSERTDPIDDKTMRFAFVRARSHDGDEQPVLEIGCVKGALHWAVDFNVPLRDVYSGSAYATTVDLRFDQAQAVRHVFAIGRGGEAAFPANPMLRSVINMLGPLANPGADANYDTASLIRRVRGAGTVIARGRPARGGTVTATFDIRSGGAEIARAIANCR